MSRVGSLGAAQMVDTVAQTHGPEAANRLMFLQWLRTTAPAVYRLAMQKALQKVLKKSAHPVGDLSPAYAHGRRGRLLFPYNGDGLGDIRPGGPQQRTYQAYEGEGMGALGQDDSSDIPDITDADIASINTSPVVDLSSLSTNPVDVNIADPSGTPTVSSATTGNIFSSIVSTVAGLASATANLTTALNPQASSALMATNAQRAAQGLPPLNANGTVMSPAQLAAAGYSSAQINTWEAALAAQTPTPLIFGLPWYLVVGAGALLAFVLMKKPSRR